MAVIGGDVTGCEAASLLIDLGVAVTVIERESTLLPGVDADISRAVARSFKRRGISIRTGAAAVGHSSSDSGCAVVHLDQGDQIEADVCVIAVGRRPQTEFIDLTQTGIAIDERGFVLVDGNCRTTDPGVYAIGSLTDTSRAEHVACAEGVVAVQHLLDERPLPIRYDRVPHIAQCHPGLAWIGPSELDCTRAGLDTVTVKHPYRANARAHIVGDADGFVKVIASRGADGRAGAIIGVHMVGPLAAEHISSMSLAMLLDKTVDQIAEFVQPHPSFAELVGDVVLSLTGRDFNG